MLTKIQNLQTRDCYYPIYYTPKTNFQFNEGYYFFDEEFEDMGERKGNYGEGYFGPYKTLDDACKEQYKHWCSIQSL